MKKQQKCQKCKEPIPEGLEKYISNKKTKFKNLKVCDRCFFKLKNKKAETLQWLG